MNARPIIVSIVIFGAFVAAMLMFFEANGIGTAMYSAWRNAQAAVAVASTPDGLYLLAKQGGSTKKSGSTRTGASVDFPDADTGDWDYTLPDYTKGFDDSSSNSGKDTDTKSKDD